MTATQPSRNLVRQLLLIATLLAVPVVPFLIVGERLEACIAGWLSLDLSPGTVAVAVFGLLASDIVLPVPSSVVITFGGRILGFWDGTGVAWCGMTAGAVIAFWLGRVFGARWPDACPATENWRTDAAVCAGACSCWSWPGPSPFSRRPACC